MANITQTFIPPIGVSLIENVGSCFSCCQASMCQKQGHRACLDLSDLIFMKTAAAAASSSITPFTPALTHLLKAPSPPPSALLLCVVAARYVTATLSKHQNAKLLYIP